MNGHREPLLANDSINRSINQSSNLPSNHSNGSINPSIVSPIPRPRRSNRQSRKISPSDQLANQSNDEYRIDLTDFNPDRSADQYVSLNTSNDKSINRFLDGTEDELHHPPVKQSKTILIKQPKSRITHSNKHPDDEPKNKSTNQCIPMRFHVWLGYLTMQLPLVVFDAGIVITASVIHWIITHSSGESINQIIPHDRDSFAVSLFDLSVVALIRGLSITMFTHYVSRVKKQQISYYQSSNSQSISQTNTIDPSGLLDQSDSNNQSAVSFAIDMQLGLAMLGVIFSSSLSIEDVILKLIFSQSIDQSLNPSLSQCPLTIALIVVTLIGSIVHLVVAVIGLLSRMQHVMYLSNILSHNQLNQTSVKQSVNDFFAALQAMLSKIDQSNDWSTIQSNYQQYRSVQREKELTKLRSDAKRDALIAKNAMEEFGRNDDKTQEDQSIKQASDRSEADGRSEHSQDKQKEDDSETEASLGKWRIVQRLLQLWRADARMLVAAFIFMLIASLSGLAIPSFTGALLSNALDDKLRMSDMYIWLALIIITGFTTQCRGYLFTVAGENFVARLRRQLHAHLLRLDVAFFDAHTVGDFSAALTADCDILKDSISLNFNVFIRSAIAVVGALIYMLVIDWRLSLVACASLPIFSGLSLTYGNYEKKQSTKIQDLCGSANSSAVQSFGSIRAVHSFHAIEYEDLLYSAKIEESRQLACRKAWWYGCYANATSVLGDLGSWNTLLYGSYLLHSGDIAREALAQFLFLSAYLVSQLQNISWIWQGLMKSLGSGERIFRLLDRQPDIWPVDLNEHVKHADLDQSISQRKYAKQDALLEEKRVIERDRLIESLQPQPAIVTVNGTAYNCYLPPLGQPYVEPPHEFTGRITFRNVCFAYPNVPEKQVLHNVSFELCPGESMALVGESGSGKSSIAALIQRFYDVTSGSIEFDGIDIRLLSPAWRSRRIAYVQQEPIMFARSIRDNIAYGTHCSQQQVEEAARQAHAHDFILRTENGYDSVLGEKGCSLSGGQRQRCCIARALVRSPNLLLFDEATSALDTQSEAEVQRAIDAICAQKNKSVIVIAHRLSTIRHSDRILVMSSGRIIEQGSHDELVEQQGKYFALVQAQMGEGAAKNNHPNLNLDELRPAPSPSPTPPTARRGSVQVLTDYVSPHERETGTNLDSC